MIDLSSTDHELQFPQTTSLRIIAAAPVKPEQTSLEITRLLASLKVTFDEITWEPRKNGKFLRYYLKATFDSLETMRGAHAAISKLPGVKAVL